MRVRLVALLVSLLLVALTLTSLATNALIRQQLMDNTDRDLRAAAIPTFTQVLTARNPHDEGIPTNYAVKLMFTDGRPAQFRSLPTGEHLLPNIPNLALNDPRVGSAVSAIGQPFTVNSINGQMRWREVAAALANGEATFAVGGAPAWSRHHSAADAELRHPDRPGCHRGLCAPGLVRGAPRIPAPHPDRGHPPRPSPRAT